jgi:hypothetical protein
MYGDLSGTLGDIIKSFHLGDVKIDNWMFRLHYVARYKISKEKGTYF